MEMIPQFVSIAEHYSGIDRFGRTWQTTENSGEITMMVSSIRPPSPDRPTWRGYHGEDRHRQAYEIAAWLGELSASASASLFALAGHLHPGELQLIAHQPEHLLRKLGHQLAGGLVARSSRVASVAADYAPT